jgi:hypothetical protein
MLQKLLAHAAGASVVHCEGDDVVGRGQKGVIIPPTGLVHLVHQLRVGPSISEIK